MLSDFKKIELLFHIAYLLIWICGCRSIPMSYHGTVINVNSTMPYSHDRMGSSIWMSNDSRHREHMRRNRNRGSGGIVFPTDEPDQKLKLPPIQSCPDGSTFCETADDYPSEYLDSLLKKSANQFKGLFSEEVEPEKNFTLEQRVGGSDDEGSPLCESTVKTIFPRKAEDVNGQLKYVVNEGKYKQGVRIEICLAKEGAPCGGILEESVPFGYKTFCKQKHGYKKLVALDTEGLGVVHFPIPACCTCMYRSTFDDI